MSATKTVNTYISMSGRTQHMCSVMSIQFDHHTELFRYVFCHVLFLDLRIVVDLYCNKFSLIRNSSAYQSVGSASKLVEQKQLVFRIRCTATLQIS